MQQKQFIDIVKDPSQIKTTQLSELETLITEYPFLKRPIYYIPKVYININRLIIQGNFVKQRF